MQPYLNLLVVDNEFNGMIDSRGYEGTSKSSIAPLLALEGAIKKQEGAGIKWSYDSYRHRDIGWVLKEKPYHALLVANNSGMALKTLSQITPSEVIIGYVCTTGIEGLTEQYEELKVNSSAHTNPEDFKKLGVQLIKRKPLKHMDDLATAELEEKFHSFLDQAHILETEKGDI